MDRAGAWWDRGEQVEIHFANVRTKEGPKVKDLSDSSPPCLRQTASRSYELTMQPQLVVDGGCLAMHAIYSIA